MRLAGRQRRRRQAQESQGREHHPEREDHPPPETAAWMEERPGGHLDRYRRKRQALGELGVCLSGSLGALAQPGSAETEEPEAEQRVEQQRGTPPAGEHEIRHDERREQKVHRPETPVPREPLE